MLAVKPTGNRGRSNVTELLDHSITGHISSLPLARWHLRGRRRFGYILRHNLDDRPIRVWTHLGAHASRCWSYRVRSRRKFVCGRYYAKGNERRTHRVDDRDCRDCLDDAGVPQTVTVCVRVTQRIVSDIPVEIQRLRIAQISVRD